MVLRGCKVAACVAVGPSPFLAAADVFIEQGQSELRMSPPWDFPCNPEWSMCKGHIPPLQHVIDELDAACATAAPVPHRRANSRIIARTRLMAFS